MLFRRSGASYDLLKLTDPVFPAHVPPVTEKFIVILLAEVVTSVTKPFRASTPPSLSLATAKIMFPKTQLCSFTRGPETLQLEPEKVIVPLRN